jgi:hypothetical protein
VKGGCETAHAAAAPNLLAIISIVSPKIVILVLLRNLAQVGQMGVMLWWGFYAALMPLPLGAVLELASAARCNSSARAVGVSIGHYTLPP